MSSVSPERTTDDFEFQHYLERIQVYDQESATFHPGGVRDEAALRLLVGRPGVVSLDGLPALVPTDKAAELVEQDRCDKMVTELGGSADSKRYVSLMPLEFLLDQADGLVRQVDGSTYIFSEYDDHGNFEDLLEKAAVHNIHITQIVNPKTKTLAALNFYQTLAITEKAGIHPPKTLHELIGVREIRQTMMADGGAVIVRRGGHFSPDEKLNMWNLFSTRFQDISDNMPVRLEEDQEATEQLFDATDYVFVYKQEAEGNISCCAFLTDEPQAFPWISRDFLGKQDEQLKMRHNLEERPHTVFVPGVAAYKRQGVLASRNVMLTMAQLLAEMNFESLAVRYECTDVSSLYVPRLVSDAAEHSGRFTPGTKPEKAGQKRYVVLTVNPATQA